MLEINLTKNNNEAIQGTLGKYYGRVEYKGTMTTKELAEHMHHHNTAFSAGLIVGMLTDMAACIKELTLMGYVIKIDDLGLFKASIDANGLTLEQGSKISAGRGSQRTDEELAANPKAQQFAVGAVKMIMQATGATTIEKMNSDAKLSFTSKTKAMVKSLTGEDASDENNNGGDDNGGDNNGGNSGGNNGSNSGGDNSGSQGQQGDQNQQSGYALTIATSGSGSATVTHDGNAVTSGSTLNEDDEVEISITPAEGQVPTASINSSPLELTEDNGVYTGSFAMPGQASALVISTGVSGDGGDGGEGLDKD
jgi:hypothetical protein